MFRQEEIEDCRRLELNKYIYKNKINGKFLPYVLYIAHDIESSKNKYSVVEAFRRERKINEILDEDD